MFYDSNKVNNILLCKQCEGRLDIPKNLPCGEAICSICETTLQVLNNNFNCLICKEKHEMPTKGLPTSKPLLEMLSIQPTKISRGKAFDALEKSLDSMQKKRSLIRLGIENGIDFVKEHCIELRSDVQLVTEKCIEQINEFNKEIIDEIDDYEKDLIEFNKTNSESLVGFNDIAKELELFYSVNTELLKQYEVDDDLIMKSNEEAYVLIKKAELEIENLKDTIFDGKLFKFEKNIEKLNKSILGKTKIEKLMIDSVILLNKLQINNLMSLCEFNMVNKWTLLYRASQDGFEAARFHSKCDNKPNTLIIIKTENGNIFGGYTEQSWSGHGAYKADQKSFIFSLINKINKPLKIKWSKNNGIFCNQIYGPTFGGGHDIYITDKSNTNSSNHSNLCHSYTHPDYTHGSNEAQSLLAGSYNFKVFEIEVYSKL
jgi:hypothetical protein